MRTALLISIAAVLAVPAFAQVQPGRPQAPAPPAPTPMPRDVPYPGTLTLHVDATDTTRGIFRVRETIPVAGPGRLTLRYPQWLPGNPAPTGPIEAVAGLRITGNGRPVAWRRDPRDVFAFHIDVPGAPPLDRLLAPLP